MDIVNQIKEKGIVGAGGAGFPTHVKLGSNAETIIVNAAECEPLLHKDKEILKLKTETFLSGLRILMKAVNAKKSIIGVKKKNTDLIKHLQPLIDETMELFSLRDFYPSGDEITLIYETTGRIIKAGSLPITEGIVVSNVETILNMGMNTPVLTKFLNVAGRVKRINSFEVPLGISYREIIDYAGPTLDHYSVLVGGPMMGKLIDNLDDVVTKTTSALIILPQDHILVTKYKTIDSPKQVHQIGKAACDQCTFCTELCPRYLLGHPIQPHLAMRSLVFSGGPEVTNQADTHTLYCCECNLCSFIACPEGLYPGSVCGSAKRKLNATGVKYKGSISNQAHPLADYRRTPSKKLKRMLSLNQFKDEGPLVDFDYQPSKLRIKLQQHIGEPASAIVKVNIQVKAGEKIATMGDKLGSELHSPINGLVTEVTDTHITIQSAQPSN
jgi:Na+-translocating ferredoxin:NAD+ oxidoreductase RnfC subunit